MTPDPRPIALVLYPGCALLDIAAPLQYLAASASLCRVTAVAARIRPVPSSGSLRLLAERTFDELPHPAALIVPGGGPATLAALADRQLVGYVRTAAAHAKVTAAVGTGALLLATAGVLHGREATTQPAFAKALQNLGVAYVARDLVAHGPVVTAADAHAAAALAQAVLARLAAAPVPSPSSLQGDAQ